MLYYVVLYIYHLILKLYSLCLCEIIITRDKLK